MEVAVWEIIDVHVFMDTLENGVKLVGFVKKHAGQGPSYQHLLLVFVRLFYVGHCTPLKTSLFSVNACYH